jgi:hypothetical protein
MGQFSPRDDKHTCAYFAAGVDDVIGAPVHVDEVVARVRALLRRIGPLSRASSPPTTVGAISLSIVCRTVQMRDVRIPLTRTELDLLVVLARNADRVVGRGQLLQTVWGLPTDAKNNVLNTCIYSLRRKSNSTVPRTSSTPCGESVQPANTVTREDRAGVRSLGQLGGVGGRYCSVGAGPSRRSTIQAPPFAVDAAGGTHAAPLPGGFG